MYEILWVDEAHTQLLNILFQTNLDPHIRRDLDRLRASLRHLPLLEGSPRSSSLHRLGSEGRLLFDFEVIPDDHRVVVHWVSLLPLP